MIRFRTHMKALALGLGILFAVPAQARALSPQDEGGEGDDVEAEEVEEAVDRYLLIDGADVVTGTGAVLRGAQVLTHKKKIAAVGYDLAVPEEAEVIDATGMTVYPGLVALESSGLFGGSGSLEDAVDPFNQNMVLALGGGITTAVNGSEVAKLKKGEIEGIVIKSNPFVRFSYNTSNAGGKRSLREKLDEAAAYLRAYRAWEVKVKSDKELKEPKSTGVDKNVLRVLQGRSRPVFSANERTDLLEIARLAQRYGFRPVISGCREGWTVADELGRAGAAAILTARDRRSQDERNVLEGGSSIENAAILHGAGVEVAIVAQSGGISLGGIVGRDIMHLPVEAAFAVRGGLSEDAALAAITRVPARLMGLGHRLGTIEPGMDADLIITDGDLLHYKTFVQWAVVDGKVVYDKQQELFFAHIRPRPEAELAPPAGPDPGEADEDVVDSPEEGDDGGDGDPEDGDSGDEGDGGDGDGLFS